LAIAEHLLFNKNNVAQSIATLFITTANKTMAKIEKIPSSTYYLIYLFIHFIYLTYLSNSSAC